jgi:hypothetical protein
MGHTGTVGAGDSSPVGPNPHGRRSEDPPVSTDPFDVELEDPELLDEVGLTASLMVAANQAEGPLSTEEIDRLLGLA